jgi:tripartite-type tricarboxylate transporter receptor subunit TctC
VRFYANKLAEKTGKTVIVDNRAGAMGYIASDFVARAKPDGYTIYICPGSSMLAAAPYLFKTLKFDPINDFEHITTLNEAAFLMCVAASSPFKTVADLTAYLKEKGDGASYASIAPPGLVASEMYKAKFGLKTVEIKYKEQTPLLIDLMGGVVAFTHIDYGSLGGFLQDGKVRALSVTAGKRLKSLPDIPGAEEAGIPGMDLRQWWSVEVPAKTPRSVCDQLEKWFNEIAVDPATVKFLADNGSDPLPGNHEMLKKLLIKETKDWGEYAKLAHLNPI